MREQVIQRVIDTLGTHLATEIAKLQTPTTPANLPDLTTDEVATVPSARMFVEALPNSVSRAGYPCLVVRHETSEVKRYASPGTGVRDVAHVLAIDVYVMNADPARLARAAWRTQTAVTHALLTNGRTDSAAVNTGQMFDVDWLGDEDGGISPPQTGGFVKLVTSRFRCSERVTAVITTYE